MTNPTQGLRLHGPLRLASSTIECWKCKKATPVHALVASDVEDFDEDDDGEPSRLECPAYVYDLSPDDVPAQLVTELAKLAPNYKPTFSRTVGETSWANVCVHCDMLQGAFFLHNEPDGPFFGGPEEAQVTIVLLDEQGFDAADGASYAP